MTKCLLKCIVCGGEMEKWEHGDRNQPLDGLTFKTQGHYPSTMVDIFDGICIEINVCDPCIRKAVKAGQVAVGDSAKPEQPLRIWEGPGEARP